MTEIVWISTGKAAAMLGYCPDHFREKFYEALRAEGAAMKLPSGHRRWLLVAVIRLKDVAQEAV